MTDLTAKRTLVKSPPELWTELSEVESLARHLGEFGEIRITKLEPETTVAWEGERASGTVEIEASGWGTKVTLTAAVVEGEGEEPPVPSADQSAASPESVTPEPEATAPEPVSPPSGREHSKAEPAVPAAPSSRPAPALTSVRSNASPGEPVAAGTPRQAPPPGWEPPPQRRARAGEPARRGFLTRLFGRRPPAKPRRPVWQPPQAPPVSAPTVAPTEPAGGAPGAQARRQAEEPAPSPVAREPADASDPLPDPPAPAGGAEPGPASSAFDAERALAVLEGTLDTLGSAHHRPFSRG